MSDRKATATSEQKERIGWRNSARSPREYQRINDVGKESKTKREFKRIITLVWSIETRKKFEQLRWLQHKSWNKSGLSKMKSNFSATKMPQSLLPKKSNKSHQSESQDRDLEESQVGTIYPLMRKC